MSLVNFIVWVIILVIILNILYELPFIKKLIKYLISLKGGKNESNIQDTNKKRKRKTLFC